MICLIRAHYRMGVTVVTKRQKIDEEDNPSSNEDNSSSNGGECGFACFGPIDPKFIKYVSQFQDYDHSKHQNYWLFTGEAVRNFVPPIPKDQTTINKYFKYFFSIKKKKEINGGVGEDVQEGGQCDFEWC